MPGPHDEWDSVIIIIVGISLMPMNLIFHYHHHRPPSSSASIDLISNLISKILFFFLLYPSQTHHYLRHIYNLSLLVISVPGVKIISCLCVCDSTTFQYVFTGSLFFFPNLHCLFVFHPLGLRVEHTFWFTPDSWCYHFQVCLLRCVQFRLEIMVEDCFFSWYVFGALISILSPTLLCVLESLLSACQIWSAELGVAKGFADLWH